LRFLDGGFARGDRNRGRRRVGERVAARLDPHVDDLLGAPTFGDRDARRRQPEPHSHTKQPDQPTMTTTTARKRLVRER
jgi:hypothetical protein